MVRSWGMQQAEQIPDLQHAIPAGVLKMNRMTFDEWSFSLRLAFLTAATCSSISGLQVFCQL